MTVFDDLAAEQDRLEAILGGLAEAQWLSPSGAAGWTAADVVLHLAQSEESVQATVAGQGPRAGSAATAGGTVDERVASLVAAERAAPEAVFARWQQARRSALAALRGADPDRPPESGINGPAGDFCRVAAHRLAPERARMTVTGPHGAAALRLLRTYAE